MEKFSAGQKVQVVETSELLRWAEGRRAIGHIFILDEVCAASFNAGRLTPEPQMQKFSINYHPSSLLIIEPPPYPTNWVTKDNNSIEDDLAEAHRLAESPRNQKPAPGYKSPSDLSDLEKCELLAGTVDKPDLKELREGMRGLRVPTYLEPARDPPPSYPEKLYPEPLRLESDPRGRVADEGPHIQPILINRRKPKRRILQMAPHQRPVISDPIKGHHRL